jgi:hypothetical protein
MIQIIGFSILSSSVGKTAWVENECALDPSSGQQTL